MEIYRGLVLAERSAGEQGKFIDVLTEHNTVQEIYVRGAKKNSSAGLSATQLFSYATFSVQKRRNQWYLDSAEPIRIFYRLRESLSRLSLAMYFGELIRLSVREHQTPEENCFVMRLMLNTLHYLESGQRSEALLKPIFELRLMTELGRVEQYVDMALTYLRLEEGGSDYVIRTCAVDDVVCAAVRRFAGEFIDRRIALDYTPVEWETVTDGKWLTFVVEQLLSNALKYTGQDGTVRIYREGDDLCIRDSGMGIAPEDLPRVFDMGYTGQNGRLDRRSSGIGLYLCRRICRNLRHEIRIESAPGAGTTVRLTLGRPAFVAE